MWGLIAVQLFIIVLFWVLGWAIRKKMDYTLIAGFSSMPKEEQQQLIESGFPQKSGALLELTAIGMLLLLPLHFFDIKYAIEIQFGFLLVFLLGGFVFLSKYQIPRKRKLSYIISISFFVVILGFVVGLYLLGHQDYDLIVADDRFEITGMYGDEWKLADIQEIELMSTMPKVTYKQNGFATSSIAKGKFKVENYGSCLLFVQKDTSLYLYIELQDKRIFMNGDTIEETEEWYEKLRVQTDS